MQWGAAQDQLGRDLQRSLPEKSARVQLCRALQTSGFASLEIVNDPQFETFPCLQKGMDLYPEISADMRKQDLCRALAFQVCKGLFGEALLGSPALQAP